MRKSYNIHVDQTMTRTMETKLEIETQLSYETLFRIALNCSVITGLSCLIYSKIYFSNYTI